MADQKHTARTEQKQTVGKEREFMDIRTIPKIGAVIAAAGIWFGASFSANAALMLTYNGVDAAGIDNASVLPGGNVTSQQIVDALKAISPITLAGLTVGTLPPMLYKSTPEKEDGTEPQFDEGLLKDSYDVDFDPNVEPEKASITHVENTPFFDTTKLTWLLAKDGVSSYVWNITGIWNGTDEIQINDLWSGQGAFSHIEIGGAAVPEPTTVIAGALLLLPFGVSTLRALRNRKA